MLRVIYAQYHIQALFVRYRYAECRYAECRYVECRSAQNIPSIPSLECFVYTIFIKSCITKSY